MLAGRRNGEAIRERADALVAGDPSGALDRFRTLVRSSAFSSNVSADKVAVFQETGCVLDGRAIAQHRAGGDRRAGLRAFRGEQGEWYTRRVRFEAVWLSGRRFVYGALNAGGMGTERHFGPFCLVIDDPRSASPAALGVFPANSAKRYCSPAGVVDGDLARGEVVAWCDRADLAAVERAAEVLVADERDWPAVLCDATHFLEAVVAPAPAVDAISAVRVRQTYLERLEDLEGRVLAGDVLHGTDSREATAFEALTTWRRTRAVAIESVG